jgi:uncharacterized repeat protein (TIGR01451 family)
MRKDAHRVLLFGEATMNRWRLAGLLWAILPLTGHGQSLPMHSVPQPGPLLYVRFAALSAMQVQFFQGSPVGRDFQAPIMVGLRPGYIYRVRLTNLPGHPDAALYPSLEVRGLLQLPPSMRSADHPAPIVLSEQDIERALAGAYITKIIYLECPENAVPLATRADEPLETELRPGQDVEAEARARGRIMVIVRLGGRSYGPQEMAYQSVPGTILFPGEQALPKPAVGPFVPWACWPIYDPILGPAKSECECLRDGGDAGLPVGFDPTGKLHGLDPADTVAEYTDSKGVRRLAISNRVCICVPRFGVLRTERNLISYASLQPPVGTASITAQEMLKARLPSIEVEQREKAGEVISRQRPSGIENSTSVITIAQLEGPVEVVAQMQLQVVVGTVVQQTPPPPDRPLVLCKWADKQAAHIGDVVTFSLRYTNTGGQPMTDVIVTDSLTGRLEYIPGSAKSDRDASFTTQPNEAGSQILRWVIGGKLLPRQSGLVTFQARIR